MLRKEWIQLLNRSFFIINARRYKTVVRFAPSPTGHLHLGGLRTALYNYLLSKQSKDGQFILRLEDTDQSRKVMGADKKLKEILLWAGLGPDQGPDQGGPHAPYIQSQRPSLYKKYAQRLMNSGNAYKCFCSAERLDEVRNAQRMAGLPPRYDGHCLKLSDNAIHDLENVQKKPFTIRLNIYSSRIKEKIISFEDLIHGNISFPISALDSTILMKSDGLPTYHLANVIDDHLMGITKVVRGKEWIASTPLHILLYEAFGWTPPEFAHLPLLTNADGSIILPVVIRTFIQAFKLKEQGYLPEAIVNFVAFLGWGNASSKEWYTMDELIREFDIKNVKKSPAVVSLAKLDFLNKCHLGHILDQQDRRLEFIRGFRDQIMKTNVESHSVLMDKLSDDAYMDKLILSVKNKAAMTQILYQYATPFVVRPDYYRVEAKTAKSLLNHDAESIVKEFRQVVETIPDPMDWTPESAKHLAHITSVNMNLKFGNVAKVLRPVLTGSDVGAELGTTLALLGKQEIQTRIDLFTDWRKSHSST